MIEFLPAFCLFFKYLMSFCCTIPFFYFLTQSKYFYCSNFILSMVFLKNRIILVTSLVLVLGLIIYILIYQNILQIYTNFILVKYEKITLL